MRLLGLLAVLSLFLFKPLTATAEGGTCPPGFYPVNSPGVMGCAPMPGGGGGSVVSGPSWSTTWGAIAIDGPSAVAASSFGQSSKRKAKSVAVSNCRAKGGTKACKVLLSFYNQCAALAGGDNNASAAGASTLEEATRNAVRDCSAVTGNCRVVHSVCTYPVRVQ